MASMIAADAAFHRRPAAPAEPVVGVPAEKTERLGRLSQQVLADQPVAEQGAAIRRLVVAGEIVCRALDGNRNPRLAARPESEQHGIVEIGIEFRQLIRRKERIEYRAVVLQHQFRIAKGEDVGALHRERLFKRSLVAVLAVARQGISGKGGQVAGLGMRAAEVEDRFFHE